MPQRNAIGRQAIDPKRPHRFVETNDAGLGAAASGGTYQGNQANVWAVTTAFLRSTRCTLPGCGKERHDPIHELEAV
jgi:hypothetical protein